MQLEIKFTRNALVTQHCTAIVEMDDADSIDKHDVEKALLDPDKAVKKFSIESVHYTDVRDQIEKVDRLKNG